MNFKSIATELFWLSASLIITILLSIFLFGWSFQKTNLDIQFNDASFLLSAFTFIAPLFFLITFIIFSIKGIRKLFSQSLPNIIIIISGLLLIFLITAISKEFLKMGVRIDSDSQSSSLGNRNVRIENSITTIITNLMTVIQLMVTFILLYITYRWGRNRGMSNQ